MANCRRQYFWNTTAAAERCAGPVGTGGRGGKGALGGRGALEKGGIWGQEAQWGGHQWGRGALGVSGEERIGLVSAAIHVWQEYIRGRSQGRLLWAHCACLVKQGAPDAHWGLASYSGDWHPIQPHRASQSSAGPHPAALPRTVLLLPRVLAQCRCDEVCCPLLTAQLQQAGSQVGHIQDHTSAAAAPHRLVKRVEEVGAKRGRGMRVGQGVRREIRAKILRD